MHILSNIVSKGGIMNDYLETLEYIKPSLLMNVRNDNSS